MKIVRNVHRIGVGSALIVLFLGATHAGAVVPYPMSPELIHAQEVQAQKREIIQRIKNLEKQDITIIRELRNELKQMEDAEDSALPKNEPREGRH
jgi:uncharacterized protein YjaG (DUF416 family)